MRGVQTGGRFAVATAMSAVAAALAGWVSPGVQAAAPQHEHLAGVNQVTTSTSGVATLQLDKPATLEFGKGAFFQLGPAATGVYGKGRILAMVLERNGRVYAESLRFSDCGSPGCSGDFAFGYTFVQGRPLQPGLYHLYVVADGAPTTARLLLNGLGGTQTVGLDSLPGVVEQPLAPAIPSTGVADAAAYTASGSGEIGPEGGLVAMNAGLQITHFVGGYLGACISPGAAPPVYAASCAFPPDPNDVQNPFVACDPRAVVDPNSYWCDPGFSVDAALTGFSAGAAFGGDVPPGQGGTISEGTYAEGAMTFASETATGLWMSFIPSESAGTTSQPSPTAAPSSSPAPSPAPTATPTPSAAITLPNTAATQGSGTPLATMAAGVLLLATARRQRKRRRRA